MRSSPCCAVPVPTFFCSVLTRLVIVVIVVLVYTNGTATAAIDVHREDRDTQEAPSPFYCPCKKSGDDPSSDVFTETCTKVKDILMKWVRQKLNSPMCACVCRNHVEIKYLDGGDLDPHWRKNLYPGDQVKWLNLVSQHPSLQTGGIVAGSYGDAAYVPLEVRLKLYDLNVIFISHAFYMESSESNPPKHVVFVPDHLFVRYNGYHDVITKITTMPPYNKPLSQRKPAVFWRGSATSQLYGKVYNQRYRMCSLGRGMNWTDLGLTKSMNSAQDYVYEREKLNRKFESEEAWMETKGIIDIDGSVNAWGLIWRLASGSLVFKVESFWTNAYIRHLEPWKHYIPIKADLSDFGSKTSLVTNDKLTSFFEYIQENANKLAADYTLDKEIHRVALDLTQAFDELYAVVSSSNGTSRDNVYHHHNNNNNNSASFDVAYNQTDIFHRSWVRKKIGALLLRLDDSHFKDDLVHRFPNASRFDMKHFHFEFPSFLLDSASIGHTCAGTGGDRDLRCPILQGIPNLPTLSGPWDKSVLDIEGVDSYAQNFLTDNEKHFNGLADSYERSIGCSNRSAVVRQCPHTNHLVLAMAEGVGCHFVALFLRTLRDTGSCAEVVFFRDDAQMYCHDVEEDCGKITYVSTADKFPSIISAFKHYAVALDFLNSRLLEHSRHSTCASQVLLADIGASVFFQRDPFLTNLHEKMDSAEVVLTEEGRSLKDFAGVHHWVGIVSERLVGRSIASQINGMPVIDRTVMLGTFRGMLKLMWVMSYVSDHLDSEITSGVDNADSDLAQGLLNFVVYAGLTKRAVRVKIMPREASYMTPNVQFVPPLRVPKQEYNHLSNPFVNALGVPYALVLRYTLFHVMRISEDWLLQYGHVDWHFQAVGPMPQCNMTKTAAIDYEVLV